MNEDRCRVCNGPLGSDRATCNQCGEDFHLALRVDSATQDCGDAWIDDEVQALVFGCHVCLGRAPAATEPAERRRYARRTGMRASTVARTRRRDRPGGERQEPAGGAG